MYVLAFSGSGTIWYGPFDTYNQAWAEMRIRRCLCGCGDYNCWEYPFDIKEL